MKGKVEQSAEKQPQPARPSPKVISSIDPAVLRLTIDWAADKVSIDDIVELELERQK
jgi:hypothetical protein